MLVRRVVFVVYRAGTIVHMPIEPADFGPMDADAVLFFVETEVLATSWAL